MDSESEDFACVGANDNFFDGLSQAPKLTLKEKLLRSAIKEDSFLETKQTSLQQKIENRGRTERIQPAKEGEAIFEEKIIIEESEKRKKKPTKAMITLDENSKSKSFEELRLIRPVLKAIGELGYIKPTPIQQLAIPVIATGKDVVASSITGSGKTAAFLIPIIQRYYNVAAVGYIRSLVVTPTRELAIQIY